MSNKEEPVSELTGPFSKESAISFTIGVLLVFLAAIYFQLVSYPLVNTATTTLNVSTPPVYMLPVFFPFGILLGDVLILWRKGNYRESILKFTLLSIVGGFSFFRLITTIPLSGHALILTYYLLHEIVTNKQKSGLRMFSGIIPYIITIYFKFLIWSDPLTFLSGSIFGVVVWSINHILHND